MYLIIPTVLVHILFCTAIPTTSYNNSIVFFYTFIYTITDKGGPGRGIGNTLCIILCVHFSHSIGMFLFDIFFGGKVTITHSSYDIIGMVA